jgi:hypothetical protein
MSEPIGGPTAGIRAPFPKRRPKPLMGTIL